MIPEDASKRPVERHLLGTMEKGPSAYIEDMEAAGQQQLVNSDVLPMDLDGELEQDFLDLGFTFGEPVDELFRRATLPSGWERKAADHSMWSYIVDERGAERVSIFYKAAFYDRRAFMRINRLDA